MEKTVYADAGWKMPKPLTKKQFDALVKQGAKEKGAGQTQKRKSKNAGKS